MKAIFRYSSVALLAAAFSLGAASSAQAAFKLRVDLASTAGVEVESTDLDLDGVITFTGAIGAFTVNNVGGFSKPALGSAANPRLDLVSANISTASRTLHLWLTDTDFTGTGPGIAKVRIGGTTDGRVTYSAYWDPGNVEFGTAHQIGTTMTFGPGGFNLPFAGSTSGPLLAGGPYSLTQHIVIRHTGSTKATSFDAAIHIPEPGSIAMLGLGLAGLAVAGRRRNRNASAR